MVAAKGLSGAAQGQAPVAVEVEGVGKRQGAQHAMEGIRVHFQPAGQLLRGSGALGQLVGHAQLGDRADHLRAGHTNRLIEDRHLGWHQPVGERHQTAAGT